VNGDTLIVVNILERCGSRKREGERRRGKVFFIFLDFASQTFGDLRVQAKVCGIGFLGVEVSSHVFVQRMLCAEKQRVVSESIA